MYNKKYSALIVLSWVRRTTRILVYLSTQKKDYIIAINVDGMVLRRITINQ